MNNITFSQAREAASGHWLSLLPRLGIGEAFLTGKHGPCPACGGRDRFRFVPTDPNGAWFCGGGGSVTGGDGFNLLQHLGMTAAEALRAVAGVLGLSAVPLSSDQQLRMAEAQRVDAHWKLDEAIAYECHIVLQACAARSASRELAGNPRFREARPDWRPYPVEPWQRELLAVKRLMAALEARYEA